MSGTRGPGRLIHNQLLAAARGESDRGGSRVKALLLERAEVGVEGARGARGRAFHQGTATEDRARVHHAAEQRCTVGRLVALSRHVDHATARSAMGGRVPQCASDLIARLSRYNA